MVHRRGERGPGLREVPTAVFRHAEGHQGEIQEPVVFPEIHRSTSEDDRGIEFRLVGGREKTTHLGRALGREGVSAPPGVREDPLPGCGELFVLPEPGL